MENMNVRNAEEINRPPANATTYDRLFGKLDTARDDWNLAILYRDDLSHQLPHFTHFESYDGDLHNDGAPKVVFFCCKTDTLGELPKTSQYPQGHSGPKTRTVLPADYILNGENLCMFFVNYTQLNHKGYSTAQVHVLFVRNDHESIEYCRAKFVKLDQTNNGILKFKEDVWYHRRFLSSEAENNVVLYINVCYAHEITFDPVKGEEGLTKKAVFTPYYVTL